MKQGISRRLAFGNIKNSRRFFVPRILTETGLLACFYIIFTLACDRRLADVKGGNYLPTVMWMGAVIIGLLSVIIMLYTNSFLMKQRKHEFGMYSVLGMEKKHICRVLFHESLICCLVSAAAGLVCGILLYKLSSLAICRLLKTQVVAGFYFITPKTVIPPAVIFIGIDLFTYLINCISIFRMKPVELLSSANIGEKEPKVKWILFILGVLSLGTGYYISLTTESPLDALFLFFVAVLLVILGTYLLFTAGSIFVLKALKRRDRYYYKPNHVTAVSGLLFRMKKNAVGLASVAILATGVLVMISSTFCLYSRTESILNTSYPQDFYLLTTYYDSNQKAAQIPEQYISDAVDESAEKYGLKIKSKYLQEFFEVVYRHEPGDLIVDRESIQNESNLTKLCDITFISADMYGKIVGEPLALGTDEVAIYPFNDSVTFGDDSFTLHGDRYSVAKSLTSFPIGNKIVPINCFGMVVSNDAFDKIFNSQREEFCEYASDITYRYSVSFENIEKTLEVGNSFASDVDDRMDSYIQSAGYTSYLSAIYDNYWSTHESLYGMYGTLLFLGILLGIVCLFATVLIIYYKQISEGYEDRSRYQIMRKIGMTDGEVKKTIRSQIMMVFFLPLITAGVHVAFAYPILTKLMEILMLDNAWLFAKWCIIVYIVFAIVYAVIYKVTAKTYYKIVY